MEPKQVQKLVEDAKNGDHRAFEALVRQTYADTYTLAYRLVGNEEDARDVVQEAYLRAHKGLKKFRGDAQLSTWLHRITANCASTYLGRKLKHRHEPLAEDGDIVDEHPDGDPVHRADIGVLRTQLSDALMELPPKLRAVVVLRDIYDLPHEAIAEQLDITESAAKVRLHRPASGCASGSTRSVGRKPMRSDRSGPDCETVSFQLAGAADGDITLDAEATRHVEACLRCQAELVQYRKLLRALTAMRTQHLLVDDGLLDDILATVRPVADVQRLHQGGNRGRRAAYLAGAATAAAAGAAGAIVIASRLANRPRLAS